MTMQPQGGPPPWQSVQPPPGSSSSRRRWIVIGFSLLVVVAVVIVLLVWKATSSDGPGSGATTPTDDGIDRTVGLLREKDPVCDEWGKYADELAENEKRWAQTDDTIPATAWTAEQRRIFADVGAAMKIATNQFEAILPKARNVVLQELIAQTIFYLETYVQDIPNYVGRNALIAGVASNFSNAVTFMCTAVPTTSTVNLDDVERSSTVSNPAMISDFMAEGDSVCAELAVLLDRQSSMLEGWTAGDSMTPADSWSAEEWALNKAVREVLTHDLVQFRDIAERAKGRVTGDLIATHNAYLKAFADAIPTYTPDDIKMWRVVIALAGGISAACEARP